MLAIATVAASAAVVVAAVVVDKYIILDVVNMKDKGGYYIGICPKFRMGENMRFDFWKLCNFSEKASILSEMPKVVMREILYEDIKRQAQRLSHY